VGKDLEEGGRGLFEDMMQYLAGEEELNHGKPTGGAQNVAEF
jgi:hypothetical protein